MRIVTQNYWGKGNMHIIPRWLDKNIEVINPKPISIKLKREQHDTDLDGVPNFADCNIWDPNEQGWLHDQGAKVYDRLRQSKLLRKRRVLAENKKDRQLVSYRPAGMYDSVGEENYKKYGKRIYSSVKSGIGKAKQFTKDVYEETKQFNPETREIPGTYFLWVLVTIKDQAGNIVAQDWRDTGERYTSREQLEQAIIELGRRGYKSQQIKISTKPVPQRTHYKENIREGLKIKKKQAIPVAQVMIHPGPGMRGQQVQQKVGYSGRSSVGYSPMFVGATRKQFRVGGDR